MRDTHTLPQQLRELSELRGLPGQEEEVRGWLMQVLERHRLSYRVDRMGNLLVSREGKGTHWHGKRPGPRRKILLAAHMDEVGLVVSEIEESGLLRFKTLGGVDARVLPAKGVLVGPQRLPGVIGIKPYHLQNKEEREQTISLDHLYIDIGARHREDALRWVQPGDGVTFDTPCEPFGQGLFKGKAFDDRAGCYLLLDLLTSEPSVPFSAAFTVQEEVGLRGAGVAATLLRPDLAVVLEATTCADLPGVPAHEQSTRLGEGPALTRADASTISDPRYNELFIEIADRAGIPWQWKRTERGGNDAGRIHLAAGGIPTISISLPCRYIHSPVSVLAARDLHHTQEALRLFVAEAVQGV